MNTTAVLSAVLLLSLTSACSNADDKSRDKPSEATKSNTTTAQVDKAIAEPAPPPDTVGADKVERDPRLVELFEKGKDCKWNDQGFTSCPVSKEVHKLAFDNQGSSELAASCTDALNDSNYHVRGLAISCIRGFNDKTSTPLLALGLDAFEKEEDAGLQQALSWALGGNATKAGIEDRVIKLVQKLASDSGTEGQAANLFSLLFPQYLMASSAPSKAAGDAALAFAADGSDLIQAKAIEALGLLAGRSEEVCPVLAKLTTEDLWTRSVPARAKHGEACLRDLDPTIDMIAAELSKGNFFASQSSALKRILATAVLSSAQVKKLKKASKKNKASTKARGGAFATSAAKLDTLIKDYKSPEKAAE